MKMTTYLDSKYRLWTEVENIPDYLKHENDRMYSDDYQYSIVRGLPVLRDAIIVNDTVYAIDVQFNLWFFHMLHPSGIITPIRNVRRIRLIRGVLITIDVDNGMSRIVQVIDSTLGTMSSISSWFKTPFHNIRSIIAVVIHREILILLTVSRELIICQLDLHYNMIIFTQLPIRGVRSVIGPIIIDSNSNVMILNFLNQQVIITPFTNTTGQEIMDVDYNNHGILMLTEHGILIYQDLYLRSINLNLLLQVKMRFKVFIRLRQNVRQSTFIRDRDNMLWQFDLNPINLTMSKLTRVMYRDSWLNLRYRDSGMVKE